MTLAFCAVNQYAALIEVEGMRGPSQPDPASYLDHIAGLRIELTNYAGAVTREPDVSILVVRKSMSACVET